MKRDTLDYVSMEVRSGDHGVVFAITETKETGEYGYISDVTCETTLSQAGAERLRDWLIEVLRCDDAEYRDVDGDEDLF